MTQVCAGCGSPGVYQMKNGKFYCLPSPNACPGKKKKIEISCLEKYGVTNPTKNSEVQKRRRQHNVEKYGVDHPYKTRELQDRVAATNLERYGSENPFGSKAIQKKLRATNMQRYGVENVSQNPVVQARREATFLRKYGVGSILESDLTKEGFKKWSLENYGTEHPMQNSFYLRKHNRKKFLRRSVEIGGKVFSVQGYEERVLRELVHSGLPVEAIETDPTKVPEIWYTKENGKRARYYPDIFIPSRNWLIEVKCMYTFLVEKEENLRKRAACLEKGFQFNFIIR